MRVLGAFAALIAVAAGLFAAARRLLNRPKRVGVAVIVDPEDHTTVDAEGGVHSVQAADVTLPLDVVESIWDPHHLERLARTYWRFLTRATLGIVRVKYTETGRYIVVLTKPFTLLSFHAPEYEMDDEVGIVRWRIRKGLLVAQEGREGDGYLEIEVRRCERVDADRVRLHVRVEVANFYPWPRVGDRALVLPGHAVTHPRDRDPRLPAFARPPGPGRVARAALPGPARARPARPRARGRPDLQVPEA